MGGIPTSAIYRKIIAKGRYFDKFMEKYICKSFGFFQGFMDSRK